MKSCLSGKQSTSPGGEALPLDFEGKGREINARALQFLLTPEETVKLTGPLCTKYNCETYDILLNLIANVVPDFFEMDSLLIEAQGHGRQSIAPGADVSRTPGWCNTFFPLLLEAGRQDNFKDSLGETMKVFHGIPAKGAHYCLLRYMTEIGKNLPQLTQPEVKFLYHGRMFEQAHDMGKEGTLLGPTDIRCGNIYGPKNVPKHKIYIYMFIRSKSLHIELVYDKAMHKKETINRLGERLINRLRDNLLNSDT